jgi:glycosyltransferase involved in cell wall biosynthesis
MKILIFSQNAGSARHGMVFRNYVWAHEWVKQGHEVTIVASGFAHSRNENPKTTGRITQEWIDGIRYIWVWGNRYKQSDIVGRLISMSVFMAQCLLLPLPVQNDFDIVIASSPHPLSIYAARMFARRNRAKLVYDIRDLWPLALMQHGNSSSRNPVIMLMAHAEKYACRHADLVAAVPQNCEPYLRTRGLPPGKFLAVANGITEGQDRKESLPAKHAQLFDRLQRDNYFTVGYAGAMGVANALHALIEAVAKANSNIHAIFVGQGGHLDKLKTLAKTLNIADRVHFLDPVSRAQVASFLEKIDVAYLGLENKPIYKLGTSPTKLNDYMVAAKPVLYACGDAGSGVELSSSGIVCEPENAAQIADALNRFSKMTHDQLQEMGQSGREWILKNRLASEQAKQILSALGL